MLKLNLKRVFRLRGVENPSATLANLGFSYQVIRRLFGGAAESIRLRDLETICHTLNCTPNDLFDWQPDASRAAADNHALQILNRPPEPAQLQELMKNVPADQLGAVTEFLQQLKKEPPR